jgi:hypothetical protein
MVIGTVLTPVIFVLGLALIASLPPWGAVAAAIVLGATACFLLFRKVGPGSLRAATTVFALGSGLGLIATFDHPRHKVAAHPEQRTAQKVATAPAPAEPEAVEAELTPPPPPRDMRKKEVDPTEQCIGVALREYSGIKWGKSWKPAEAEPFTKDGVKGTRIIWDGSRGEQDFRIACFVAPGATPWYALYVLHPITGEPTEVTVL